MAAAAYRDGDGLFGFDENAEAADAVDSNLPGQASDYEREYGRDKSGAGQTPAPSSARRSRAASSDQYAEGQKMDERFSSTSRAQLQLDTPRTETNVDEQPSVPRDQNADTVTTSERGSQGATAIVSKKSANANDVDAAPAEVDKFTDEDLNVSFAVCCDILQHSLTPSPAVADLFTAL